MIGIKLKTCATCKNLTFHTYMGNMRLYGCGITGDIIPHKSSADKKESIFWRIPIDCPRPDSEVDKSEDLLDESEWERIEWQQ